jgi:hypothetical protein
MPFCARGGARWGAQRCGAGMQGRGIRQYVACWPRPQVLCMPLPQHLGCLQESLVRNSAGAQAGQVPGCEACLPTALRSTPDALKRALKKAGARKSRSEQ